MRRCIFLHGIRTEPDSPVKGLIPYLEAADFKVIYPEYGYELALETRIINPALAGAMLAFIEPGDLCVGHSNGCALIYEMMARGAPIEGAAFINGALEQNFVLPPEVKFVDVYSNQGDEITVLSKLAAEAEIVDADWGPLGHGNYTGTDARVAKHYCDEIAGMPQVAGHSDLFSPRCLQYWGPFVASTLASHLT